VILLHTLVIGDLVSKILIVFQELIVIVAFVVLLSLQRDVQMVNVVIGIMGELGQEAV